MMIVKSSCPVAEKSPASASCLPKKKGKKRDCQERECLAFCQVRGIVSEHHDCNDCCNNDLLQCIEHSCEWSLFLLWPASECIFEGSIFAIQGLHLALQRNYCCWWEQPAWHCYSMYSVGAD